MAPIKYCCASGCYSTTGLQQFPAASGNNADKLRRKAWIDSMRRHMNDKNWQLTRNLHVCEKHFPNGDTANGVPDFGAAVIFQNTQQNSSEILMDTNIETKENIHHQVKSTVSDHIPVNTEGETAPANQAERVEEIEVDAADWLPKTVSHQFKEQFIGNDPRYVSVIKDNLMMHIPQQSDQTKSAIEKTIGEDSHTVISEAGTVIFTGGKENVVFKENVKVEGKKFIETETGEMYEILSVEEPHDNMEIQHVTKLGSNTYVYDNTDIVHTNQQIGSPSENDDENGSTMSTARKEYKLEPHTIGASKDHTIPSMFCGRNTLNQAIIGVRSTSNVHAGSGRKSQKRSASHMKTLDTNLDVDHSFDFVRTLSAENIKLQEANVRLKEAEAKRVHEHACLQKKVKRMERERIQLLSGLEETGFTEAQIEFVKRKGSAELQEKPDPAAIAEGLQSFYWGRETIGRAIRMRLVLGTQSYNYLVRLGLPLPPQIAIDDHITKMEKEVEDETNVVNEADDQELAQRIINEESSREEHLRASGRHIVKDNNKTRDKEINAAKDPSKDGHTLDTLSHTKSLKQICFTEDLSEIPHWFAKSKDVRVQTCFPNAFDPKYLMARRKIFKQMKLLKEEQQALKDKTSNSVIKLTPCAPPNFVKNLKFKPIKGHVLKPKQNPKCTLPSDNVSKQVKVHNDIVTINPEDETNVQIIESANTVDRINNDSDQIYDSNTNINVDCTTKRGTNHSKKLADGEQNREESTIQLPASNSDEDSTKSRSRRSRRRV